MNQNITVTTLFFSFAADRMNARQVSVPLPGGSTLGQLISEHLLPRLGPESQDWLYSVNQEWAARDRLLQDGDEVAVIPPVSGG